MDDQQLQILIQAKDEASAALGNIQKALDGLGQGAQDSGKKSESLFATFTKGNLAAAYLKEGIDWLGNTFKTALADAGAFQQSVILLSGELGKQNEATAMTTDSALKLAESLSKTTLYSDDMIVSAEGVAARYQNIGKDVFPQVMQASADLATVMKTDLGSATEVVSSAMNGNQRALLELTKAGVLTKNQQTALGEELKKTGGAAKEQKDLMDDLGKSIGGLAADQLNTFDGQMTKLKENVEDTEKNIASGFLPLLTNWGKELNGAAANTKDATEKNTSFAETIYRVGKVLEAAWDVLKAGGHAVYDLAKMFIDFGGVVTLCIVDAVKSIAHMGDALGDVGTVLKDLVTGNFSGMVDAAKKLGGDFTKALDFSDVKKGGKAMVKDIEAGFKDMDEQGGKAADALQQAITLKGFDPITSASKKAGNNINNNLGDGATAGAAKAAAALETFQNKMGDVQDKLGAAVTDFVTKSTDALDAFKSKISDIQGQMSDLGANFLAWEQQDSEDYVTRKKDEYSQVVQAFMAEQDQLKSLQTEKENYDTNGITSNDDAQKYNDLVAELAKENSALDQYRKQYNTIDTDAATERNKTQLDKLQEKFAVDQAAQVKTEQQHIDAYHKSLKALQDSLADEQTAYDKAKADLLVSTTDKYTALLKEVDDGWTAIVKDAEGHVAELQAAEAAATALKASINSTAKETATQTAHRAAGGPIEAGKPYMVGEVGPEMIVPAQSGYVIPNSAIHTSPSGGGNFEAHVLEGATIHIHNEADENRLVQKLSQGLARTMQAARMGLATAN